MLLSHKITLSHVQHTVHAHTHMYATQRGGGYINEDYITTDMIIVMMSIITTCPF